MGQPNWTPDGETIHRDKRPSTHNVGTVSLAGTHGVATIAIGNHNPRPRFVVFDQPLKVRRMEQR